MTKFVYEDIYRDEVETILKKGKWVYNKRTGRKCLTIPRYITEIPLEEDTAPLLQGRPSYPVSACAEILGYLRCLTNAQDFKDIGSPTWFTNANETQAWLDNPNRKGENDLGKVYGAVLGQAHIANILDKISNKEDDRGLILDFWNHEYFPQGCLRPCMFQHMFTITDDTIDLTSIQRSQDTMCGKPFNVIQVYFLGMLAKQLSGIEKGSALHVANNVHIYDSHIEGVEEYLSRSYEPLDTKFALNNVSVSDIVYGTSHAKENFTLEGYKGQAQEKIYFELVA